MSSDEESLAIGRLVQEHRDTRQQRTLLEQEMNKLGYLLANVGQSLKTDTHTPDHLKSGEAEIRKIPSVEAILDLQGRMNAARKREGDLLKRLNEAGIQVR